ncbi:hypothetical protein Tco_1236442 [Tanacetum coccineum]
MPRGTTQVVTRGHLIGGDTWPSNHLVRGVVHRMQVRGLESEAIIGVRGSAIEGSRSDVAHCDWWIQLQTAGGYEV